MVKYLIVIEKTYINKEDIYHEPSPNIRINRRSS